MRAKLGGSGGVVLPVTIDLPHNVMFLPGPFLERGYTGYTVVAIGAAGGYGGGKRNASLVSDGGAPGGGGLHIRNGLLADLPTEVEVFLGVAGADGADEAPLEGLPGPVTVGGDGGYSAFYTIGGGNVTPQSCYASGGKGGTPSYAANYLGYSGANGGAGGIGGSVVAGGGGAGGVADVPNASLPEKVQSAGQAGSITNGIGKGGGGGAGGVGNTVYTTLKASSGGPGSYDVLDSSFSGPEGLATDLVHGDFILPKMVAGAGGGAKAQPLNAKAASYGSRAPGASPHGAVIIRLS